jgi:uncharacterized LabA/DUF88 family protein
VRKPLTNVAYIDNTNLHKGCEAEGFVLDYGKFRTYLTERFGVRVAYIFTGYVARNEGRYRLLRAQGYTLIFKPTLPDGKGNLKGNCDAELVLQAVHDYYNRAFEKALIVSSDGDFACLISFLEARSVIEMVISPRGKHMCSTLIKRFASKIVFLPDVRGRIEKLH